MNQVIKYSRNICSPESKNIALPEKTEAAEAKMLDFPQVECAVSHHFGAGIYIREVRIPAGTFSIGHHQNLEHMNHMVKGRVIMLNEDGTTSELVAPKTFTAKPGRKIGYIVEDMVWRNIYPTNETDIDTLEETYLTKSETWKENNNSKANIEYLSRHEDREDYKKMLIDVGVSHEIALSQSENESDQIPLPSGSYKIKVSNSNIQGKGVLAASKIKKDEVIAPARINGKRTPAGRFTNHALNPNARMIMLDNGDINLVATKEIKGCYGGKNGDEITIDYRQAVVLTRGELCLE